MGNHAFRDRKRAKNVSGKKLKISINTTRKIELSFQKSQNKLISNGCAD